MLNEKITDINEDESVDIRDLVRLKKIMADNKALYYAAGITTVCGSEADKTTWMYKVNSSGLYVREAEINAGEGDHVLEIAQLSDFHVQGMTDEDSADSVLAKTYQARHTATFQNTERNALNAMEFGALYDKIFVTGDATDFLSQGSLQTLQNVLGESGAKVALGNHEYRKVWFKGTVDGVNYDYADTEALADRYAALKNYWPNNLHYYSEVIDDKVMCIVMNNGSGSTYEQYYKEEFTYNGQTGTMDTFLAADIAEAKEQGYIILIFQHCPISTGKAEDRVTAPITYVYADTQTVHNFYTLTGNRSADTAVDKAVYNLITQNADVIKGVFTGHMHSSFYTEIKATANGADAVIPQYTLTGNFKGEGSALKITVTY